MIHRSAISSPDMKHCFDEPYHDVNYEAGLGKATATTAF